MMVKKIILSSILLFSTSVLADDGWEYQVVFLPGPAAGAKVVRQAHGGYLDTTKTDILNKLAAQGWQLVTVAAHSGEDHAAYLRREK
jgi:hypothetical protein